MSDNILQLEGKNWFFTDSETGKEIQVAFEEPVTEEFLFAALSRRVETYRGYKSAAAERASRGDL